MSGPELCTLAALAANAADPTQCTDAHFAAHAAALARLNPWAQCFNVAVAADVRRAVCGVCNKADAAASARARTAVWAAGCPVHCLAAVSGVIETVLGDGANDAGAAASYDLVAALFGELADMCSGDDPDSGYADSDAKLCASVWCSAMLYASV